ncbi:MAG: hypothetical protein ACR2P1_14395 [Pseudomonadales bacterium]
MPTYHPPHHNRLLDLEHHIRHHQPRDTAPRQRPAQQSLQGQPSYRELANKQPTAKPPCQAQGLSRHQQLASADETKSRRTQARSEPDRNPPAAPGNSRPRKAARSAGAYRQLAAEMGKQYYRRKPIAQTPQDDLPEIQTPIKQAVVEEFAAAMPDKREQQPTPSPASRSTKPPSQPEWKGLATTILQARLGAEPEPLAKTPEENPQQEVDWAAIDEAIALGQEAGWPAKDQSSAPLADANSLFGEPSAQHLRDRTGAHALADKVPPVSVTIEVSAVDIRPNEVSQAAPATTKFPQDLDAATTIPAEELSAQPAADVEELQTDGGNTDVTPPMNNPGAAWGIVERITTADLNAVTRNLKSQALRFYRHSCRPQMVKYSARLRREIQKHRDAHDRV